MMYSSSSRKFIDILRHNLLKLSAPNYNYHKLSLNDERVKKFIANYKLDEFNINNNDNSYSSKQLRELIGTIKLKQQELIDLTQLAKENEEYKEMAKSDSIKIQETLNLLENQLFNSVLEPESLDNANLILEVSAGVGGQEAMLFTDELFHMYQFYSLFKGWNFELLSQSDTEIGGLRQASASISGPGAYKLLKYEGGVHRVQRVPKTEKTGRIHTSTSTVSVIPSPSQIEVNINPSDLKIDTKRASGAGGQHVNKTESAVRITHIPTGIVVECQTQRSQIQNRASALAILNSKLYQKQMEAQLSEVYSSKRLQVGERGRNEKIRTYNYTQDRVTDHRIGYTTHNLEQVLGGGAEFDKIIKELEKFAISERLEQIFK